MQGSLIEKYHGMFRILFDEQILHLPCFPFREIIKNVLQQGLHKMWLIPWKFSSNF